MTRDRFKQSLADKLRAAGHAPAAQPNQQDTERQEREPAARQFEEMRATRTIAGITGYALYVGERGRSLQELIAWGGRWFDELVGAGHGGELAHHRVSRPEACHSLLSAAELRDLEQRLGWPLSRSHRALLTELGGLRWGQQQTLDAAGIVATLEELQNVLDIVSPEEIEPYREQLRVVPLSSIDSNHDFVLRNVETSEEESPIYFVRHDDSFLEGGHGTVYAWCAAKLEEMMVKFVELTRRAR